MGKPSEDDWTTVAEETPARVEFDTLGDEFIGTFKGKTTITPNEGDPFDLLLFEGTDGELYSISGYKLMQAFEDIKIGTLSKITYIKDVDTGRASPMKDFKVQTKA